VRFLFPDPVLCVSERGSAEAVYNQAAPAATIPPTTSVQTRQVIEACAWNETP